MTNLDLSCSCAWLAFKCRHGHMLGFFIWQVKGNTRKSGEHIENQHPPGQVLPVFPFVWCPGVFTTCGSWSNKQPGQGSVLVEQHVPTCTNPLGRCVACVDERHPAVSDVVVDSVIRSMQLTDFQTRARWSEGARIRRSSCSEDQRGIVYVATRKHLLEGPGMP